MTRAAAEQVAHIRRCRGDVRGADVTLVFSLVRTRQSGNKRGQEANVFLQFSNHLLTLLNLPLQQEKALPRDASGAASQPMSHQCRTILEQANMKCARVGERLYLAGHFIFA